ncbi:hypothetical protein [Gluconacetobacter sacchari]|uniref:hypothetical protein n=1 Tax=Gluconacetobacter sacchari TaxID=92759 RepID=UPI00222FF4C0|nr:hypothetical protein [Gluconacetobacter sacchari]
MDLTRRSPYRLAASGKRRVQRPDRRPHSITRSTGQKLLALRTATTEAATILIPFLIRTFDGSGLRMVYLDIFLFLLLIFYPTAWLRRTLASSGMVFPFAKRFIFVSIAMLIISGRSEGYFQKIIVDYDDSLIFLYYCMVGFVEELAKTAGAIFLLRSVNFREICSQQFQCFLGVGYFFWIIRRSYTHCGSGEYVW